MKKILLSLAIFLLSATAANAQLSTGGKVPGGPVTLATQTISTNAETILAANGARKFLQIQNVGAANKLACTLDGSTPVISGNGIQLSVEAAATYDVYVPTGAVKCIGSAAGTVVTVISQ